MRLQNFIPHDRARIDKEGAFASVRILNAQRFKRRISLTEVISEPSHLGKIKFVWHRHDVKKVRYLYVAPRGAANILMRNTYLREASNDGRAGYLGRKRHDPRAVVGLGNLADTIGGLCGCLCGFGSLMQSFIRRNKHPNGKSSFDNKEKCKDSKPKASRANVFADITKATAPAWLLLFVISLVLGGAALIIYGTVVWLCVGVGLVAGGWLALAVGWGWAWGVSDSVLGHR
jgi:hypothetical protein